MGGDIEVDEIDIDPDGTVYIRGRITDPDLVAALTRDSLTDVSVEIERPVHRGPQALKPRLPWGMDGYGL